MLRKCIVNIFTLLSTIASVAQEQYLDSLKQILDRSQESKSRVEAMGEIADYYGFVQLDSCLLYSAKTIELATALNFPYGIYLGYIAQFHGMNCKGDFPKALQAALNLQRMSEQLAEDSPWVKPFVKYFVGVLYLAMDDRPNAIFNFRECIEVQKKIGSLSDVYNAFSQLGIIYGRERKLDSALADAQNGLVLGLQSNTYRRFPHDRYKYIAQAYGALGNVYFQRGQIDSARDHYHKAIEESQRYGNYYFEARNYYNLAELYARIHLREVVYKI